MDDRIWIYTDNTGWRTAVRLRTVERGKHFGKVVVRSMVDGREFMVSEDDITPMNEEG